MSKAEIDPRKHCKQLQERLRAYKFDIKSGESFKEDGKIIPYNFTCELRFSSSELFSDTLECVHYKLHRLKALYDIA